MYVNFGINFTAYTHAQMWPVSLVVLTAHRMHAWCEVTHD